MTLLVFVDFCVAHHWALREIAGLLQQRRQRRSTRLVGDNFLPTSAAVKKNTNYLPSSLSREESFSQPSYGEGASSVRRLRGRACDQASFLPAICAEPPAKHPARTPPRVWNAHPERYPKASEVSFPLPQLVPYGIIPIIASTIKAAERSKK